MDVSFVFFAVVAFLAVVLCLEGLYNLWASRNSPEAKRIARRLQLLAEPAGAAQSIERALAQARLPRLDALLEQGRVGRQLKSYVRTSGSSLSAAELTMLSFGLGMVGLFLPLLLGSSQLVGAVLGLGLALLPWWRLAARRRSRIQRIERQLPEALDLMSRSMRAGHAFPSAVKMVADEMPEPLGPDFRILFDEMNYGVPTAVALVHLAERVPVKDVSYFVVAVLIQRESGGNLAELLDNISGVVRKRLDLLGEVRTLSAEGKLSAYILTALPFVVGLAVNLINPEFMSVLWTDPVGHKMVGASLVLMLLGVAWMRRIVRIRV